VTLLERHVLNLCDLLLVHTDFVKNQSLKTHGPHFYEKIRQLSSGVDVETFRPLAGVPKSEVRIRLGLPIERTIILTARRLVRRTDVDDLI
jgi:glycosyltransferase involved in cell wall biosynthesis